VPEYSLFNSADDCLAYSLDERAFDESLLLNVLFQDRILLNEAYFFNSTLLADHVKSAVGHPSLFELASRENLIVPAFRDRNTETLDQAYEMMRHEYGPEYELLSPQMQPYRDRVVASIDVGLEKQNGIAFFWPSGKGQSGDGYRDLVREMLQTDRPPAYVQDDPIERSCSKGSGRSPSHGGSKISKRRSHKPSPRALRASSGRNCSAPSDGHWACRRASSLSAHSTSSSVVRIPSRSWPWRSF